MLSESQFNEAKDALQNDANMPEAARSDLTRLVDEFEEKRQKKTPYAHPALEETFHPAEESFGPTGLEPGAPAARALPRAPAYEADGLDPELLHKMDVMRSAPLKSPNKFSPANAVATGEELAGQMALTGSRKSASGRSDIYRPPEFVPPTPTTAANDLDSVWGKLAAVKKSLPASFGGETEHFLEPTIDQFRIDMARVLPPSAVMEVHESDPLFLVWKDKKWEQAYDAAQAAGHPIVRQHYAKPPKGQWEDSIANGLESAVGVGKSALVGADKMAFGGIGGIGANLPHASSPFDPLSLPDDVPHSLDELAPIINKARTARDYTGAQNPIAEDVGGVAGALLPQGIGNQAVKGAGALLRKAPQLLPGGMLGLEGAATALLEKGAESIPGRLAGHAAAGYIGGAASRAAGDLPDVALGQEDLSDAASRANDAGLMGAPMGLLGGTLGEGLAAEGRNLRRDVPSLQTAEEGGASLGAKPGFRRGLPGFQRGAQNEALIDEAGASARELGSWDPDVVAMISDELKGPHAKRAQEMVDELTRKGAPLREFEKAFEADKRPLWATIDALLKAKKKITQSDGSVLSVNQPEVGKLDKILGDIVDFEPIAPTEDTHRQKQFDLAYSVWEGKGGNAYSREVGLRKASTEATTPITPEATERRLAEPPPSTKGLDLGEFGGDDFNPHNYPELHRGERFQNLHEAKQKNPYVVELPTGYSTDEGGRVGDMAKEWGIEHGLPPGYHIRVTPRLKNPGDLRALVDGIRTRHESGSVTKEPFPNYEGVKLATHQDRDLFTGETDAIPRSTSHTLENGQEVKGYSAANARLSSETGQLDDLLGTLKLDKGTGDTDLLGHEAILRKTGEHASPAVDEAIGKIGEEAGTTDRLNAMRRYKAMRELEQLAGARNLMPWSLRHGGGGTAARLRLDPILQSLIPYLSRTGNLGAGPGLLQDRNELPEMADQATLDEIRRALGQ